MVWGVLNQELWKHWQFSSTLFYMFFFYYISYRRNGLNSRKTRLIEGNANCRHLKKFTCEGTLRQVFICLRLPPGFLFGVVKKFCGLRIWSGTYCKILHNMVSNRTSYPTPPITRCIRKYSTLIHTGGGGRVEPERRGEGQGESTGHKAGLKSRLWVNRQIDESRPWIETENR